VPDRYLVTGGAGFIGSHIVENLLADGHHVRVLDDFSSGRLENLAFATSHPRLEVVQGDVRDFAQMRRVMKGIDGVFHEAAMVSVPQSVEQPELSADVNARGTAHVLGAAREAGVRRVVFASSSAVYGDDAPVPVTEEAAPAPMSPYGVDKLYGEHLGTLYDSLYGLETCALRYFNVFGPRQDPSSMYSGVISIFVEGLRSGRPLTIYGDGEQSRDFVYVADVVRANRLAMATPARGFRALNVGRGERTTLNELVKIVGRLAGKDVSVSYGPPRAGDVRHSQADVMRIRSELGWMPAWSLEAGLAVMLAAPERV
jgi:nucleoside-diphosphate-sugar epimerase